MEKTTAPHLFIIDPSQNASDASDLQQFNETLARLGAKRRSEIAITGPLMKSKLAWQLAIFQQSCLYRVVMLANGCALNWNSGNLLCSYLTARALIETCAIFLTLEKDLENYIMKEDLKSINTILMNLIFSTRDEEIINDNQKVKALNILTYIDKLDRNFINGIRKHYNYMSERCHPNINGQLYLFGFIDKNTNITHFSDLLEPQKHLNYILAGAKLLPLVETAMAHIDDMILRLAEIHHRIPPIAEHDH